MVLQIKTKYINYPIPLETLFFDHPEFMFVAAIYKSIPKLSGGQFGDGSVGGRYCA
jgi:hypothetical protein